MPHFSVGNYRFCRRSFPTPAANSFPLPNRCNAGILMIALIQRVTEATVTVDDCVIARIDTGLLTLVGIERTDTRESASQLARKLAGYCVFADDSGKMNLDIRSAGGAALLVPQFTLAADTRKGRRPGFSTAADPASAVELFQALVADVELEGVPVCQGRFGADMKVGLINDGPVTLWLQSGQAE